MRLIAGQGEDLAFEERGDVTLPECIEMAGNKTAASFSGNVFGIGLQTKNCFGHIGHDIASIEAVYLRGITGPRNDQQSNQISFLCNALVRIRYK